MLPTKALLKALLKVFRNRLSISESPTWGWGHLLFCLLFCFILWFRENKRKRNIRRKIRRYQKMEHYLMPFEINAQCNKSCLFRFSDKKHATSVCWNGFYTLNICKRISITVGSLPENQKNELSKTITEINTARTVFNKH